MFGGQKVSGVGKIDGDGAGIVPKVGKFEIFVFEAEIIDIPGDGDIIFTIFFEFGQTFFIVFLPIDNGVGTMVAFLII